MQAFAISAPDTFDLSKMVQEAVDRELLDEDGGGADRLEGNSTLAVVSFISTKNILPSQTDQSLAAAHMPSLSNSGSKQSKQNHRRKEMRHAKKLGAGMLEFKVKAKSRQKLLKDMSPIRPIYDARSIRTSSGGFTGLRQPMEQRIYALEELKAMGFQVVAWDGR